MNPKQISHSGKPGSTEPIPLFSWKNRLGYFNYELPVAYCINDYEEELAKVIQTSAYFNELPWVYQTNKEFIIKAVNQNKKIYDYLDSDLQKEINDYAMRI